MASMRQNIDEEFTQIEKIKTLVFNSSYDASEAVAQEIATLIRTRQQENKKAVLGLATGNTPISVYEKLVEMHQRGELSFKNVVTFNLDEYYPIDPNSLQSYHRFMKEYLFDQIDIDPQNIHIPQGNIPEEQINQHCQQYEEQIIMEGGIDIQILGIGRTGHIGFNEPGASIKSKTRLVHLDKITMCDAASDFFGYQNVPKTAITMGIRTILQARQIFIIAFNEGKSNIAKKAIEGQKTQEVAASLLQDHDQVTFILDKPAAAKLTRFECPWTIKGITKDLTIDYNKQTTIKAVVWLSQKVKRSILRLREEDYIENGLQELIREKGAGYINILVTYSLRDSISGWPAGGKPQSKASIPYSNLVSETIKKVLIFSPHPDDDVICMGSTMHKLVKQGHNVSVAYQTSGSIAVHDYDVSRAIDLIQEVLTSIGINQFEEHKSKIDQFLQQKIPTQADMPEVEKIKSLIRKTEARAAATFCGVQWDNIHFLNLPFYQTGTVKKKPLSEQDVIIVLNLMEKIQPDMIFCAGDLSDPHGTHRTCLDSILNAFDRLRNQNSEWFQKCTVFLYRGAWQEWEVEKVSMAVPMSPEEVLFKRYSIFKHQSQKDIPMFPGYDSREFWQRVEARNRTTAQIYDQLGFQQYEGIECFVKLDQVLSEIMYKKI